MNTIRGVARSAITTVAVLLLASSSALAQSEASVAFGGGIAHYHPIDDLAHDSTGFGLAYRFGKGEGLQPTVAFNWFSMTFDGPVGGDRVTLGKLKVRPIMGGYGYARRIGPFTARASLVGGYSFNRFDADDSARLAYQRTLQTTLLRISASNSFAASAAFDVWYDISARFGLLGVVGFMVTRPEIDIITDVGHEERRLRTDSLKLQIGVAYGIF